MRRGLLPPRCPQGGRPSLPRAAGPVLPVGSGHIGRLRRRPRDRERERLRDAAPVRICTGEKIEGFREFFPFIVEGGIDVLHPDLCWCGGLSGGRGRELRVVEAAAGGHGTTRNGQQVRVSGTTDLTAALVATGFSYDPDRRGRQAEVLVGLLPQIRDIRRMGGAATDLASVSCGRGDAYFEQGLNPWDCAAGIVLVSEAGGRVTDLDGRPSTGEMMVAAPAAIHGPLLDLLQTVGADRV